MRFDPVDPPREFEAGYDVRVTLRDCARVRLAPNEQVTFTTESGAEYDVARKEWGFYATPSLNGRLEGFGLRGVLVKNRVGRFFVLLVERGKEPAFEEYVRGEPLDVVAWLDSTPSLEVLERAVRE